MTQPPDSVDPDPLSPRRPIRRRSLFRGALGSLIYLPLVGNKRLIPGPSGGDGLGFEAVPPSTEDRILLPEGYRADLLVAWGDPVRPEAPVFDPKAQSAAAQALQFGYNADHVGFFPLPLGSRRPDRGILVINHELTHPELMFEDWNPESPSRRQVDIQLAAHGMSILEIYCDNAGRWHIFHGSRYNRRITGTSPIRISGPALGHPWLRTAEDPSGSLVTGTLANCAAGITPWGTYLCSEENFHEYFGRRSALTDSDLRYKAHDRYGIARSYSKLGFERIYDRFHIGKEPNEAFRFGWVVEVDPHDPEWQPRKRSALGRMRREGATPVVARDGRIAVYSGEDIPFEYVYKFVSKRAWNPSDRPANRDLLDEGTLYAARFLPNGRGEWLSLVQGQGPLQPRYGWNTQADVLIMAIEAAYQRGATKMDRPEGIAAHPESGQVFIALTKNEARGAEGLEPPDAANPRANNRNGHVIELDEDGGDAAALQFSWRIFLLCGDPKDPSSNYAGQPKSSVSALSCPDNLVFDERGHLWIATDGQPGTLGFNDGLYAVPVEGPERGRTRRFLSAVAGAEVTGPSFTPGGTTLFVAIQHPGEGGSLAEPISSWPDGKQPPRPGVIVVRALDGRPVGSPPPA